MQIKIKKPWMPKKITGTKLSEVLGLSPYTSKFEAWAVLSKIYKPPFAESKFTAAGKILEPRQIEFFKESHDWMKIRTPADFYGENPAEQMRYDYFPENDIFGGMWDAVWISDREECIAPIEMKTASKDWEEIPQNYMLQVGLYSYLMSRDTACIFKTHLKREDYENPEQVVVDKSNCQEFWFYRSEKLPDFEDMVKEATAFYREHVEAGISPEIETEKDLELLETLKTLGVVMDGG